MVFKEGVTFASKYLVMYARPNELGFNRLGLSISKKAGIAVTRNKIKRRLREAMRRLLQEFPLNYDFIIIARKSSVVGGLDDFIRDIKRFMIKITEASTASLRGVPIPTSRDGTTKQSQERDSPSRMYRDSE